MFVSFIQSNFHGIGSGLSAGDTGVFLHNRGAGFTLSEGHPNELHPGRRPLHTLSPTMWTAGDEVRMVLGTRGGSYQPQLLLQVLAHLEVGGLDGTGAQAFPRWVVDGFAPNSDPKITVEPATDAAVIDGLVQRGHEVDTAGSAQAGWGPISLIRSAPNGRSGFADPRVSTSAAISGVGRDRSELA
jgi:gamma-glutamyltranspeptidase/glutathione hydrolase